MNGHPLTNSLPLARLRERLTTREVLFLTWGAVILVTLFLLRFGLWMPLGRTKSLQSERARLILEERVAQRAAGKQAKLAIEKEEIARQVSVYRRASFPGMAGGPAALRFLADLEEIARDNAVALTSKTARSLPGTRSAGTANPDTPGARASDTAKPGAGSDWETLNAELVVHGRASRIFQFLRGAALRFPQVRLDNLVLTRSQDGASWEARVFLVLARPVLVAGLRPGSKGEYLTPAGSSADADVSLPNLLSARAFGERPAPPPVAKMVATNRAAIAAAPMRSAYQLLGFAGDETGSRAVLRESATGKTVIVGVGDRAGGEKIIAIGRRGVDVVLPDGSRQTLPLP